MVETSTINEHSEGSRKPSRFFWTMLALSILDAILLLWLFNPIGRSSKESYSPTSRTTLTRQAGANFELIASHQTGKPSPLGKVAGSRPATRKIDPFVADASRRPKLMPALYTRPEN